MRSTIIPAQITTVEDKIAGSLTFTQIMLFMLPVIWFGAVYVLISPTMHMSLIKAPLVTVVTVFSLLLALRVKGKLVLEWLTLIATFNICPKYYVFNKNSSYQRSIDLPVLEKKKHLAHAPRILKKANAIASPSISLTDLMAFEKMAPAQNANFSFTKKGGFHVVPE